MKKKLLILGAAVLALQAYPVLADSHGSDDHHPHAKAHAKMQKHMMKKQDTNGDGQISKDEFLSHAEERFNTMDADGNGQVTPDEAKAAKEKWREKMHDRREKMKERHEEHMKNKTEDSDSDE